MAATVYALCDGCSTVLLVGDDEQREETCFAQFMDVATQLEEYLVEVRDHVLVGWVGGWV